MIDIAALHADVFNPLESDLDYFIRRRRELGVCDIAPGPEEDDGKWNDPDPENEDDDDASDDVDEDALSEETTERDDEEMADRAARKYESDRLREPRQ